MMYTAYKRAMILYDTRNINHERCNSCDQIIIKQLTGSEMGPVNSHNGEVIKRYQNFNYLVNVRFLLVV